jgi:hypothetical protein
MRAIGIYQASEHYLDEDEGRLKGALDAPPKIYEAIACHFNRVKT